MKGKPKIDEGIPIPAPRTRGYSPGSIASTMRAMNAGDSVLLECTRSTATTHAWRNLGRGNYVIRAEGKGWRVWKTEDEKA